MVSLPVCLATLAVLVTTPAEAAPREGETPTVQRPSASASEGTDGSTSVEPEPTETVETAPETPPPTEAAPPAESPEAGETTAAVPTQSVVPAAASSTAASPTAPAAAASPSPTTTETAATPAPSPETSEPEASEPEASEPEATSPSETPAADATVPASASTEDARPPRVHPRLVVAVGMLAGPHAIGNEECDSAAARCETKGSFFGFGGQLELRARVYKPLYVHLRGLAARNVSPNERIYRGVLGGGVGLGAYGRRIFGRAEYVLLHARGDNHFEPPFFQGEVATDEWGNHAGMVAVGFRQPLPKRFTVELWGGVMFGPRSVRTLPQMEPDERVLTTFQLGLNLAFDAWR